jgi:hypothetical protein
MIHCMSLWAVEPSFRVVMPLLAMSVLYEEQ